MKVSSYLCFLAALEPIHDVCTDQLTEPFHPREVNTLGVVIASAVPGFLHRPARHDKQILEYSNRRNGRE